tara:strand:- start:9203 stop:9844 length:642 start_codon:yes stop_codon:yes gene_type:complete
MIHETYQEPIIQINNNKKEIKIILTEKTDNIISNKNITLLTKDEVDKILYSNKIKGAHSLFNSIHEKYNNNIDILKNLRTFRLSNITNIINDFREIDKNIEKYELKEYNYKSKNLDNIVNQVKLYLNMYFILFIFQNTKYENIEEVNEIHQLMYNKFYILYNKIDSIKHKDKINEYKNEIESSFYLKYNINICKLKEKEIKKFEKYVQKLELF